MNKTIKAVVFDAGSVLVDWKTICWQFADETGVDRQKFIEVFCQLSLDPETGSDLGYMTTEEFFAKLAQELGVAEKAKNWRQRFVPGFKRIEETYQFLDEIKGKYKLAMLTNSKLGIWEEWESVGHFKDYFEVIIDSSVEHILKPDPRLFNLICQKFKLRPEESLFVDDEERNLAPARKLGFKTVQFTGPEEGVKKVRRILGLL